ncbi:chorismate mutase [Anaerococcus sp. AGMB00486]|uniref:Prephenate dehydratase n=2 Tax=Anaerococcus TaxID=165779 RepID=A0ABX2NC52_9FIRM|nr:MULTISPECIES: prephenate dehydratase domain-containing protein [Anaerococcus]MDY3006884.1 prephenate dehydratase domain-containing protein [Anaerococcus porci]MSS77789.1 chorismate mutase [Anaerococcus porci]NVF12223.1 chorismate mutase [Anaerococcus faecalis]
MTYKYIYDLKNNIDRFSEDKLKEIEDIIKDRYQYILLSKEDGEFSKKIYQKLSKNPFIKKGKIAVGGCKGSYADQVANIIFEDKKISYFKRFSEILDSIEKEKSQYGILPLENSSYGSVKEVYNLMLKRNFYIIGSFKLDINHFLLGNIDANLADIKEVYSHPQALGQCRDYIYERNFKENEYFNTALSAKYVKESNDKSKAAIASKFAAKEYGLKILDKNIQNEENNYTRFIIVAKDIKIFENSNKISIRLKALDKPGSLIEIVEFFKILGINMTKLESSPIPGSDFKFIFYFDFDGNIREKKVRVLLDILKKEADDFEFMGNYIEF